jgi:hypothetical protein
MSVNTMVMDIVKDSEKETYLLGSLVDGGNIGWWNIDKNKAEVWYKGDIVDIKRWFKKEYPGYRVTTHKQLNDKMVVSYEDKWHRPVWVNQLLISIAVIATLGAIAADIVLRVMK